MGFLSGKRALIVGLASNRSIAWGIAKAMHAQGAQLAFGYQNEKLRPRAEKMAAELGSELVFQCDVAEDREIEQMLTDLGQHWSDGFDILVHSVAYAPREALEGDFLSHTDRESFRIAHDISVYSFAALARAALPLLAPRKGSMLTLSYLGGVRTVPNYNVMGLAKASLEAEVRYMAQSLGGQGVRVNAISAGPIRTLAASGIKDFKRMLEAFEHTAPLGRCVTIDEVGNVAAFLCSDLASGVTGEITYVDGGFSTVAMGAI